MEYGRDQMIGTAAAAKLSPRSDFESAKIAKEPGPMDSVMRQLIERVAALESAVGQVEHRFGPVVRPVAPEPANGGTSPTPMRGSSPLAEALESISAQMGVLTDRLSAFARRSEL